MRYINIYIWEKVFLHFYKREDDVYKMIRFYFYSEDWGVAGCQSVK